MDDQSRNLIFATALCLLLIILWSVLFPPDLPPEDTLPPVTSETTGQETEGGSGIALLPPSADAGSASLEIADPVTTRTEALEDSPRITIDTPRLAGSISLQGGRIDDLALLGYREDLAEGSPDVTLLSPAGGPAAYYALYGWAPAGELDFNAVPNANTDWALESGETLSPGSPVTLVWDNGAGLIFRRTIAIDADYMFTVTQSVENTGTEDVRLAPYGIVARHGLPDYLENFFISHEGVVRVADGTLDQISYDNATELDFIERERANAEVVDVQTNGWIGFADKYWMTTLIPDAGQNFSAVTRYTVTDDIYQTEARLPTMTAAAGEVTEVTTRLFSGAKEWEALRHYQNQFSRLAQFFGAAPDPEIGEIDRFMDAIDWGWFYFLTEPIFWLLHTINLWIGNMGIAIIGLTLLIKAVLFPLAFRSYVSMAKMKELQPEMEKLRERAGDDRQKLQEGMMELYKKEKVNPASGCLPILMQIPIFFSLYKVIFVTIELRHAPFFGWLNDLSAPDSSSIMNLFGLLPFDGPEPGSILALVFIGVLPILLGVTMWLQQKLNPAPPDPTQAAIFAWLPWVFMFMLGGFASGLLVYWIANNTLTFTQQYLIMRSHGHTPDVFGNIRKSFTRGEK
ncbi:MAG: membrane protein insertase YidC [Pseudomonadota bacterium]